MAHGKIRFAFHPERYQERVVEIEMLHDFAGQLATVIDNTVPEGRQKSIAFTELESVLLRCVRGLTEK